MLLSAATGALAFWVLTAVSRADFSDPTASRYVYIGAVFILLMASAATAGLRLGQVTVASARVLVAAAVGLNLRDLRGGERSFRHADESVRAALAAVQIAAPVVAPGFMPHPPSAPQITAGPYLAAVQDLGSPTYTLPEVRAAPEGTRVLLDAVLERAEGISLRGAAGCARLPIRTARRTVYISLRPRGELLLKV
jgi:hypothetical protein